MLFIILTKMVILLSFRESDDTLTINLQPETPGDLGFEVAGYKTADGR